jgi:hypothetical protein
VGRVRARKWVGGGTRRSKITYELKDTIRQTWIGEGDDMTKRYRERPSLVVFYQDSYPRKNVAIGCTGWRVRAMTGELIRP